MAPMSGRKAPRVIVVALTPTALARSVTERPVEAGADVAEVAPADDGPGDEAPVTGSTTAGSRSDVPASSLSALDAAGTVSPVVMLDASDPVSVPLSPTANGTIVPASSVPTATPSTSGYPQPALTRAGTISLSAASQLVASPSEDLVQRTAEEALREALVEPGHLP